MLVYGPKGNIKKDLAYENFCSHEILTMESVCYDIIGENFFIYAKNAIIQELSKRINSKLLFGQRSVVVASNLSKDERDKITNFARNFKIPTFYIYIDDQNNKNKKIDKSLVNGDNFAEVINISKGDKFTVIKKLPVENILEHLQTEGFHGLSILPDVHGMKESLINALYTAKSLNRFVFCLGDFIDYGPDPLEVTDIVYNEVIRGNMAVVWGNHENKITRWINGHRVNLSEGNKVTTRVIESLNKAEKQKFETKWRAIVSHMRHYYQCGNVYMTHGAFHPNFWRSDYKINFNDFKTFCLFGEVDGYNEDGYPNKVYAWCDAVPSDKLVFVGHDIRNKNIHTIETNDQGGKTVFLDLGSGKGGALQTADLPFNGSNILSIRTFNRH